MHGLNSCFVHPGRGLAEIVFDIQEERIVKKPLIGLPFILVLLMMGIWTPTVAQDVLPNVHYCEGGAFSTEEDFMAKNDLVGKDPYVSDGDLLSVTGYICARNRELLERPFDVSVDLGLDAVHIIDFGKYGPPLIAFSTEIDSPHGNFSSGDVLFTNGAVIPNRALMQAFKVNYDVGLDGLQMFGDPEKMVAFANNLPRRDDPAWNNAVLQEKMKEYGIEIWFSIETTVRVNEKDLILDGDILSADGTIISHNRDLHPLTVPAGIVDRGVDFGTDAIAVVTDPETGKRQILYSTEILYNGKDGFTDGDVLQQDTGIILTNDTLIAAFKPNADFLGLDALWLPERIEIKPTITSMCERDTNNFNGGVVLAGDSAAYTGLWRANYHTSPPGNDPRRPCGLYVPIDGPRKPLASMNRFRVAYRPVGTPVPTVGSAHGIETRWYIPRGHWEYSGILGGWQWICPEVNQGDPTTYHLLETTGTEEWMDASDFLDAENGVIGCTPVELRLAVWNSASIPATDPTFNPDGHYIVWLEWEDSSGMHRENADHHIQLDNTAPTIAPYPDGLQIRLMDGKTIVPTCGETSKQADLQIWASFYDEHYWYSTLALYGGDPPASWSSSSNYYDPNDGTAGVKNTYEKGTKPTIPPAQPVHLRDLNMFDALGKSFKTCCYLIQMYVYDAAILHSFDGTSIAQYSLPHQSGPAFITFSASP